MKALIATLALLAATASTAEATPSVGDQVSFQGTWDGQTVYQHLAFTAWNAPTQQFTQVTTTKIGAGAPATETKLVNYNDTASDAALQYIVANCAQYQGVNETIQVPAGIFPTCKMPINNGTGIAWIGVVPFAVVRIQAPVQGKMLDAWLTGVVRGI